MMTKENIKRKYDLNSADILLQASNTDTPINSKLDLNWTSTYIICASS